MKSVENIVFQQLLGDKTKRRTSNTEADRLEQAMTYQDFFQGQKTYLNKSVFYLMLNLRRLECFRKLP